MAGPTGRVDWGHAAPCWLGKLQAAGPLQLPPGGSTTLPPSAATPPPWPASAARPTATPPAPPRKRLHTRVKVRKSVWGVFVRRRKKGERMTRTTSRRWECGLVWMAARARLLATRERVQKRDSQKGANRRLAKRRQMATHRKAAAPKDDPKGRGRRGPYHGLTAPGHGLTGPSNGLTGPGHGSTGPGPSNRSLTAVY